MSEELIVATCSPTMAGLKTGNMFNCPLKSKEELKENIRKLNKILVPRGVRILPLKISKDKALLYMYRPTLLRNDLNDTLAIKILSDMDYPIDNTDCCIVKLIDKLKAYEDFPHEIGLFLGYPAEDVHGFIKNCAKCAKCVGTWKVYGDEKQAIKKFKAYKKCTKVYCECYRKNNSFDRLVVCK